jgi:hypothetical protein
MVLMVLSEPYRRHAEQDRANETEVAGLIYQLIGRELAHKMKVSNTLLAAEPGIARGMVPRGK